MWPVKLYSEPDVRFMLPPAPTAADGEERLLASQTMFAALVSHLMWLWVKTNGTILG